MMSAKFPSLLWKFSKSVGFGLALFAFAVAVCGVAQEGPPQQGFGPPGGFGPPDGFGPPEEGRRFGGGPFGGRGGFPGRQERKILQDFDKNEDGWLNKEERQVARASLAEQGGGQGGPFGGRGRRPRFGGPFGGDREPPQAGQHLEPNEVEHFPDAEFYDPAVVRTLFLEFEEKDWEKELEEFHGTDVDVAAKLTVDGKEYPGVGVHFRGMSSYMMVPTGYKRSLNVELDMVDEDQRLYGYKNLNLLNCSGDRSFLSTALYSQIARLYIPVPQANFVRVVINGEDWGIYANVQQFDKIFLRENFELAKGTRWKVPGSPGGDGGLRYLGDEEEPYRARFEIKSSDGEKAWEALIELCRVLNETPLEKLEEELEPMLDIESTLWFLALDITLVNSDGYWTRASDYNLFLDAAGKFHVIPHDMNEAFASGGPPRPPGGRSRGGFGPPPGEGNVADAGPGGFGPPPGFGFFPGGPPPQGAEPADDANGGEDPNRRRGRRGFGPMNHGGPDLDPLTGLDDPRMPLRSRLLQIPALREKYLAHVQEIADKDLDWGNLGPIVAEFRDSIAERLQADTRKLSGYEEFERATSNEGSEVLNSNNSSTLKDFAAQRRDYLLNLVPQKQ